MIKIWILLPLLICLSAISLTGQEHQKIDGLPLRISSSIGSKSTLVLYITGDGGWSTFSNKFAQIIANEGFGVISINSRKYFWHKKTPATFASDIEELLSYYLLLWAKTKVVIIGYSFGADVAAFLPSRFSPALLAKVNHLVLLSPSLSTDFVINLSDLIGDSKHTKRQFKVANEVNGTTIRTICIFGTREDLNLKNSLLKKEGLTIHELPGGHNYDGNTPLLLRSMDL